MIREGNDLSVIASAINLSLDPTVIKGDVKVILLLFMLKFCDVKRLSYFVVVFPLNERSSKSDKYISKSVSVLMAHDVLLLLVRFY